MTNSFSRSKISLVAGGFGFVAANLIPRLLQEGRSVVAADNGSRGQEINLRSLAGHPRLHVVRADLSEPQEVARVLDIGLALGELDEVWHLAANSDIPAGVENPKVDLKDTFLTTFELLRGMQERRIGTLHFASSSAIYGDLGQQPLHEAIGPLLPISNYGAMKLASEAQISAAAESHLHRANIFRFPNVVGIPATHGVILDFVRKLKASPQELQVLGNGTQQKAYLHVSDLVEAMLFVRAKPGVDRVDVVNIGPTDDGATVRWIAEQVVDRVSRGAKTVFGQEGRGWVGDVPRFNYCTDKLQSRGWRPTTDSLAALKRAIDEIATQEGA